MDHKSAYLFTMLLALFATDGHAIQGTVLWSTTDGTYKTDLETGATAKLADWGGYARVVVSPDGRQVAACGLWQADGGILVVNTDGTHDSVLTYGSDYRGSAPNRYSINTQESESATYNYGLGRPVSFGPNGVYFVRCTGKWTGSGGQTSRMLCYADRATGLVHEVIDISAVDDDHSAIFVSSDGRRALSSCHSRTVCMDVNATYDGGSYHYIDGIWGHGPTIPADGRVVIVNNIRGSCDMLQPEDQYDHRTWVVYNWADGACGNFLDRYESPSWSPTGTGIQAMVRGSTAQGQRGEEYITFGTDGDGAYLLHWSTGTVERIPRFGEVFLGRLPTGDLPTLSVAPASLSFTAGGTQSVTVSNVGAGTLGRVSASISYAGDNGWLTAVVQGTGGNTQTIANTVNASSLPPGSHTATVTVSGGGATNRVSYTVSVDLNVPGNVSTSVSGTRFRHVTVTWTDNSSGETGYSVERSSSGGAYNVIGAAPANATSYVDSNVTCGSDTYSYRLRATFLAGACSGYSSEAAVTVSCANWIDVIAPTAGAVYHPGDTVWIQWEASNVGQVYIEGTLNDGDQFGQISTHGGISPAMETWGNFPWVPMLPAGVESTTVAYVRVAEYTDRGTTYDVSGVFTVYGGLWVGEGSRAPRSTTVAGLKHNGLVSLGVHTPPVYTLKPGQQATIRVFRPNGALVHSIFCTEPGTHALGWHGFPADYRRAGKGLYLVDMVIRHPARPDEGAP